MGLHISVDLLANLMDNDSEGYEHERKEFETLSRALEEHEGIVWREPETTHKSGKELGSGSDSASFVGSFPYSYLYRLRRAYVYKMNEKELTPMPDVGSLHDIEDTCDIQDASLLMTSHLLCHGDSAGYYIPLQFEDPIFLPKESPVAGGGMVGSSYELLAELERIAPFIGIVFDANKKPLKDEDKDSAADFTVTTDEDLLEREKYAWSVLYYACKASIRGGHAITFH